MHCKSVKQRNVFNYILVSMHPNANKLLFKFKNHIKMQVKLVLFLLFKFNMKNY